MAKGDDIQERCVELAVAVIRLCDSVPRTPASTHIIGQLLRCGTSPAPNYAEARGAESDSDFVHKLRIVLKELNETEIWRQILIRGELVGIEALAPVREDCANLSRIIAASLRTMKEKHRSRDYFTAGAQQPLQTRWVSRKSGQ